MNKIEELNKLKEEKKVTTRWRAEEDENYFYVDECGDIDSLDEYYDEFDNYKYNTGNYFKTEKQAKEYKEKLLIYQQLKDLALELNNGEKVAWNSSKKYYIYCNMQVNELAQTNSHSCKDMGQVYCLAENFLDIAKERIGEERLKKLFKEEQ